MSAMELGQVGKGKILSMSSLTCQHILARCLNISQCFLLLFSVLTNASASAKLCVKIIVVKIVISVLLIWSRIIPKIVVSLDGELSGNQYEHQLFIPYSKFTYLTSCSCEKLNCTMFFYEQFSL